MAQQNKKLAALQQVITAACFGSVSVQVLGYFACYVSNTIGLKHMLKTLSAPELLGSALLGSATSLFIVLTLGWQEYVRRSDYAWTIRSGLYGVIVTPGTLLLYCCSLPVVVVMVVSKGLTLPIGWGVDKMLVRRGLKPAKTASWMDLVLLAIASVAVFITLFDGSNDGMGDVRSISGLVILVVFLAAHAGRIYQIRHYLESAERNKEDLYGFFVVERIVLILVMGVLVITLTIAVKIFGWDSPSVVAFLEGVFHPEPGSLLVGVAFGLLSIPSFLLMAIGGSGTFATLLNKVIGLLAGFAGTYIGCMYFGFKSPGRYQYLSFWILLAVLILLPVADRIAAQCSRLFSSIKIFPSRSP